MPNRYHCCATCQHFRVVKEQEKKTNYQCSRLGYQTQPKYRFNCWTPNEIVKKKLHFDG